MLQAPRSTLGLWVCLTLSACSGGNEQIVDTQQPTNTPSPNTPTPDIPTPDTPTPDTPTPNTPNVTPPANSPPAALGSGLSGQWDVIFSSPSGRTKTLQVTMSPTLLEMSGDIDDALVITNGSTFDVALEGDKAEGTRTTNSPIQLGIMPLPLAGAIHFTDGESSAKSCDSLLSATEFSLSCSDGVGGGFSGSKTTATNTKSLASDFGDVGGEWAVTSGKTTCTATLEGSTVVVACRDGGRANGSITITIDGGRVSGITSGGAEFTAQRR